jgi:hypothetical protein
MLILVVNFPWLHVYLEISLYMEDVELANSLQVHFSLVPHSFAWMDLFDISGRTLSDGLKLLIEQFCLFCT